ncbi:hypothetical protein UFOVP142_24 [uncultured Caudovirales phage]|uniref:Uncharacterized protein n=1 Tax=uncultured Caudovirales phage TaxID=2100421 RepID=A0A6J7XL61_9CAUD|nr:hypothetical protein UFOVP142_24 [uncultured Caudovirales phage]
MTPGDEHQVLDLGWMAAPMWFLFSGMEVLSLAIAPEQHGGNGYVHHLIDVSPALLAAAIGVLHWYSVKEYRKQKLSNDLEIAKLQARSHASPPTVVRQEGGFNQVVS